MADVTRKPQWKQETPRAQLVVLFSAVQGSTFSLEAGILTPEQFMKRVEPLFTDIQDILTIMPEGSWDEAKAS